jgi:hypothetical protein
MVAWFALSVKATTKRKDPGFTQSPFSVYVIAKSEAEVTPNVHLHMHLGDCLGLSSLQ